MEHRSDLVRMSEQLLRIAEVKHTLQPIVPPVTLPKKYVSILKSSNISGDHNSSVTSRHPSSTRSREVSSPSSASSPKVKHDTPRFRESFRASLTRRRKSTKPSEMQPGSVYSDDGGGQLSDVSPPSSLSRLSKHLASAMSRSMSRSSRHRSFSESREQESRNKDVQKETKFSLRRKSTHKISGESKSQFSPTSQKRDVMQFIQEQEQSLQERFLSMPQNVHKKQRSLTPTLPQSAGLDHLDNLVRLMEQLTTLKDENNKLRKRCDYLESTRTLLQTKSEIIPHDRGSFLGFLTPQSNHKYDHKRGILVDSKVQQFDSKLKKPRKSKSEEFEMLDITDSSSDEESIKCPASAITRSFSTGSIAAPATRSVEIADLTSKKRNKGYNRRMKSKQKSKSSKWSRVKQALSGQKHHDDERSTERTFLDQRRASNYPSDRHTHSADDSRSTWYTASESDREIETSQRSLAPKQQLEDEDPDLTSEIWMGPPDWWEEYESRREGSGTSSNSQASSIIEITTMYLGSPKDTTRSTIKSRMTTITAASTEKSSTTNPSLPQNRITSAQSLGETTEEDSSSKDISIRLQKKAALHKSSSARSTDLGITDNMEFQQLEKKAHRSAWGRVKDIIHTRKDSIKKKLKKDRLGVDNEENRDSSTEAQCNKCDAFSENYTGHVQASSDGIKKQKVKVGSESPPKKAGVSPKMPLGSVYGNVDIAALLAGGVSEEFSKKMQEWEQLKSKKSVVTARASVDESDLGSLEYHQEFPVHTIDLRDYKGKVPDSTSEVVTTEECNTSMEVLGAPSESIDDKGRREGDSLSRRMQVEREEAKLEKERKKVEKHRIRTLQCEEKLEKLKNRLIQSEAIGHRSEGATFTGSHTHSKQDAEWNSGRENDNADESQKDNQAPKRNSTEDTTPLDETNSDSSLEDADEASAAQKSLTKSNIATLERANTQLLENLHKKEIEYAAVQDEVKRVNEKLAKVREDHEAEMARFHSDLAKGKFAGPVKLEVGELEATADQLEEKIKMMENFGEKLASSMESAAIGKWQSLEAEDTVHKQLLELIEEMRNMLIQAAQSKDYNEKVMALSNFETRYAQAMKLQVQMNNLRLSHLERNREIMVIKRQLLLQEVNNLLLQADITRKETELYQFQEAKIFGTAKRWYTNGVSERQRQQTQTTSSAMTSTYLKAGTQGETRARQLETPLINIPYQSEEVTLASAPSSSSACLSTTGKSDGTSNCLSETVGEQLPSSAEGKHEQFTEQKEAQNDQSPCRGTWRESNVDAAFTHKQLGDPLAESELSTLSSPQFSEFANQVLSKKCPSEPQFVSSNETQKDDTQFWDDSCKYDSHSDTVDDTVDEQILTQSTQQTTPASKINAQRKTLTEPGFTTVCDSVPLHNEIAELKRVKCEVARDVFPISKKMAEVYNPTSLDGKHDENRSDVAASAAVAPDQAILREPRSEVTQSFQKHQQVPAPVRSQSAQSPQETDLDSGEMKLVDSRSQQDDKAVNNLQSTSDTGNATFSISAGSVTEKKVTLEQKEQRVVQDMGRCVASPRESSGLMTGKPPLPAKERGPRSKSASDVDRTASGVITSKPLQEVVRKFEKRDDGSDSKDLYSRLRKSPSPTLHLPRVGLVSRVRRIKPAAELLAESQRYVRGHTTHATCCLKTPSSQVDQTSEVSQQTSDSTNAPISEGSNQKCMSLADHTFKENIQKSGPTNGDTLEGDIQKIYSTNGDKLEGDIQKICSTNGDELEGDIQKICSTNNHTFIADHQKPCSKEDTILDGDIQKSDSVHDDMQKIDNQKSYSTNGHTLERNSGRRSSMDQTSEGDYQTPNSTEDFTTQEDRQKIGSKEDEQEEDNQISNSSNILVLEEIHHKESVLSTDTNRLSQDTSPADDSGSCPSSSDLFLQRTGDVYSQPKCVQPGRTHLPSVNFSDIDSCSSPLSEQVCGSQTGQLSNVLNDEGNYPVVNVQDSKFDQQGYCSSTSEDLNPGGRLGDLKLESSLPLINDHRDQTSVSISPQLLPDSVSAEDSDQDVCYKDNRNSAGTSTASEINIKLKKPVLIQSTSAPASPCPQHAREIKQSRWKSERLFKEKSSSNEGLPSPSPSKSRKSRRPNETIETLCKQSISAAINPALAEAHLYTSLITATSAAIPQSSFQSDTQSKHENTQLVSCHTEAEATPSSPATREKIKSTRILDAKWLQKSKKFFKVSK